MTEWSDRLPGYDAWRTREHNRLFWFEEEQVMDEREAEEKRDAEIRGRWELKVTREVWAKGEVDGCQIKVEATDGEGAVGIYGDIFRTQGELVLTRTGWEQLRHAVDLVFGVAE